MLITNYVPLIREKIAVPTECVGRNVAHMDAQEFGV
jgi:hypothetical protein